MDETKTDAPEIDRFGNILVEDDGSEDRQLAPEMTRVDEPQTAVTVIELFPGRLSPLAQPNRFEKAHRAARVAAMMSLVPLHLAKSTGQIQRLADRLALFDDEQRGRWAAKAGCALPVSTKTWDALVAAVRARTVA